MAINDDVTSIIYMDIILSNTYISPIFSDIRLQYFEANQKYTLYFHYSVVLNFKTMLNSSLWKHVKLVIMVMTIFLERLVK